MTPELQAWGAVGGLCVRCPLPDKHPNRFRFVGRPGDYVYIFRSFRMEEVSRT